MRVETEQVKLCSWCGEVIEVGEEALRVGSNEWLHIGCDEREGQ